MKKAVSFILVITFLFCCSVSGNAPSFAASKYQSGVDVSENNGDVDFEKLQSDGNSFVMVRLGYYTNADKNGVENIKKACAAGMKFGVYFYSYAYNAKEAALEKQFILSSLKALETELTPQEYAKFNLVVAYDVEEDKTASGFGYKKSAVTAQIMSLCRAVYSAGYVPAVYSNLNWFTHYIDVKYLHDYRVKIWYANYNDKLSTAVEKVGKTGVNADMWQYSDSSVDKNVLYDENFFSKSPVQLADVSLSKTTYVYSGKKAVPAVSVSRGGKKLVLGTDYTVTVSANTAVGKASVSIKGIGKYCGTTVRYFNIIPKTTSVKAIKKSGKNALKATVTSQRTQTSGYQIQCCRYKSFKSGVKSITLKNNAYTQYVFKNLARNSTYYFRVRTYKSVGKLNYCSAWSALKSART